ncbi:MAG TPA: hypothetical protein VFV50_06230 [Bdellovibrionales bacterium]|nr:hypothetical protein [Bdellovibrionales bacterium]
MTLEHEPNLGPSSAFTLAAIVAFITVWANLQAGNNSRTVEPVNTLAIHERQFTTRVMAQQTAQVEAFFELVKPADWTVDMNAAETSPGLLRDRGRYQRSLISAVLSQNLKDLDLFHRGLFTDALYFMMQGQFDFEDPVKGRPLEAWSNWLRHVDSLQGVCESTWRSGELDDYCVARKTSGVWDSSISVFSLKPILLEALANHLRAQAIQDRLTFVRLWIASLKHTQWTLPPAPRSLAQVPEFLAMTMQTSFGLSQGLPSLDFALYRVDGLSEKFEPYLIRSSQLEFPLLFEIGPYVFLNHLRLPSKNTFSVEFKPRKMIWQTCELPTLGELAALEVKQERVLLLRACGSLQEGFRAYFLNDVNTFATANPTTPFVSVFIPSVRLALKWGAKPDQKFQFGGSEPTWLERMLGLDTAEGQKVSAVIPMIDAFRPERAGQSLRMTR